jgi:hypothetical protein
MSEKISRADDAYVAAVPFLLLKVWEAELAAAVTSGGGPIEGGI